MGTMGRVKVVHIVSVAAIQDGVLEIALEGGSIALDVGDAIKNFSVSQKLRLSLEPCEGDDQCQSSISSG